jgi:hypothetical protein
MKGVSFFLTEKVNLTKVFYFLLILFFSCTGYARCDFTEADHISELRSVRSVNQIDIRIADSRKWSKNAIKIFTARSPNIPPELRKSFSAVVTARYGFGSCVYKAKVRQSGDWKDHIQLEPGGAIKRSLNVDLEDNGNISGIVSFKLFIPETRGGLQEVMATDLLRRVGFITPRTRLLSASVNGESSKYLFQENARKELLEFNGRREGPILEGDETLLWGFRQRPLFSLAAISMARIVNANWARKGSVSFEISYRALSKIQYEYMLAHVADTTIRMRARANKVRGGEGFYPSFETYELLLRAMHGAHALAPHNRRFYFNSIEDKFEPIYYDGNISVTNGTDFINSKYDAFFNNKIIELIPITIKKLKTVNETEKNPEMYQFISNVIINLNKIIVFSGSVNEGNGSVLPDPPAASDSFKRRLFAAIPDAETYHLLKNKNDFVVVQKCTFDECITETLTPSRLIEILERKFHEKFFIGSADLSPRVKETVLEDGTVVLHSVTGRVYENKGEIKFTQKYAGDWFLLSNARIERKKLTFIGVPRSAGISEQRFNSFGLTGCVTIYNSSLNDVNFDFSSGGCEDSLNLIQTKGSIRSLRVRSAYADALDFDFSSLRIRQVSVFDSVNDCVDVSGGSYDIEKVFIRGCGDKGISVGEGSIIKVSEATIQSAITGIASKDSSIAYVGSATISASRCGEAFKKKQEFSGARLEIERLQCAGLAVRGDASSRVTLGQLSPSK